MEGVYIIVSYRRIWWLAELCKTSGRISFCEKLVRFYRSSEKKLIIEALKSGGKVSWINWSGVEESYQKDQI